MDERTFYSEKYRFGFNGKENDNEVKGGGSQQDYGMRIYDTRLGRFLSADPLIVYGQKYPELSTYQFASNTPISAIDLDGLEGVDYIVFLKINGVEHAIKRIVESDVYVGISNSGISYSSVELNSIKQDFNYEYNSEVYKDNNNLPVNFKFNIFSFDIGDNKLTYMDNVNKKVQSLKNDPSNFLGDDRYRGVVLIKDYTPKELTAQGSYDIQDFLIRVSPIASNHSHSIGHEKMHDFLRKNPVKIITPAEHDLFGGIFSYEQKDPSGNITRGVQPISPSNVNDILKWTTPIENETYESKSIEQIKGL